MWNHGFYLLSVVIERHATYRVTWHVSSSPRMRKDLTSKRELLNLWSSQKLCGLTIAFHTKMPHCLLRWGCMSEGASSNVSALCRLISVLYCNGKEEISVL